MSREPVNETWGKGVISEQLSNNGQTWHGMDPNKTKLGMMTITIAA